MTEIQVIEKKPALPLWARIALILVAYILFTGIFQFLGMMIAGIPSHHMGALGNINIHQQVLLSAVGLIPLALIIITFRKFLDRKTIFSMGFSFKNRFRDLGAGFIIAMVIMVGGSLILYTTNQIGLTAIPFKVSGIFFSFILFVIVALNEEILFRGYILNNLLDTSNKYVALLISALIFSMLHSLNPNFSFLAFINILLAGIILGSTYIFTRNIWFPISLHLFWNFLQGPVMGYSVSGMKIESIYKVNLTGSDIINGGQFGFEGSLVCTLLLIPAILMILFYYQKFYKKTADLVPD
jgi:membrane protease YdiL (CAAX protease family)